MAEEFDLDKTYTKILTKEELVELINNSYDEKFVVCFLPRAKDNADILIRSLKKEVLKSHI